MAVTKKQPVAKNAVIANSINTAVSNLELALEKANKAIAARSAESKKLMNESRRLRKRHIAQMNRKKRAIAAEQKNSNVETRKAVKATIAELNATKKSIVKTTASRQAVLEELNSLKQSQKYVNAYVKGIYAADRVIERANKKKRTKR
jgi:GTPase SAR1 family protein